MYNSNAGGYNSNAETHAVVLIAHICGVGSVVMLCVFIAKPRTHAPRPSVQHDRDMERARGNCLRMFFLERAAVRRAHVHEHNSGYYLPVLLCESRSGVLWHCMHSLSVRDAMCAR